MFAEFEKIIHEKMWNDTPLTAEILNDIIFIVYIMFNKKQNKMKITQY